MTYVLYTDGGARGNPGPAAIGGVLKDGSGQTIDRYSRTIGRTTNNQAEYQSLIHGLTLARAHGIKKLSCYLDSELVVRQLQGSYRIKDRELKEHAGNVRALMESFEAVSFFHVVRSANAEADALVNAALDRTPT